MRRATFSTHIFCGEKAGRSGRVPGTVAPPPAAGGVAAGGAAWATCGPLSNTPLKAEAEVIQARPAAATRAAGTARNKGRNAISKLQGVKNSPTTQVRSFPGKRARCL